LTTQHGALDNEMSERRSNFYIQKEAIVNPNQLNNLGRFINAAMDGQMNYMLGNQGVSPSSDFRRRDETLYGDVLTTSGDIVLRNCTTTGRLSTMSGNVNLTQGQLTGHISTMSGDVTVDGTTLHGCVNTISGDISLKGLMVNNSDNSTPALKTTSGDIEADHVNVVGWIETTSGKIALKNESDVMGNVTSNGNNFEIENSKVSGTLTAVGESLQVGDGAYVEKIKLKTPFAAYESGNNRSSAAPPALGRWFANASNVIISGQIAVHHYEGDVTIYNGNVYNQSGGGVSHGPRFASTGHANRRSRAESNHPYARDQARQLALQTITLGKDTEVGHIDFEAVQCIVDCRAGAQYTGHRPTNMTVLEAETTRNTSVPRQSTSDWMGARSAAQARTANTARPSSSQNIFIDGGTYTHVGGNTTVHYGNFINGMWVPERTASRAQSQATSTAPSLSAANTSSVTLSDEELSDISSVSDLEPSDEDVHA
jgi:hypothetical protein